LEEKVCNDFEGVEGDGEGEGMGGKKKEKKKEGAAHEGR
jgi:hypothetical protein